MSDSTHRQTEKAETPSEAPATGKRRSTLEVMRRRLEEHSPLEELGPLFGPEAQGRTGITTPRAMPAGQGSSNANPAAIVQAGTPPRRVQEGGDSDRDVRHAP
jgi:hypothetical protein